MRPGTELGLEIDFRQTDDEAELIGWVHEAADDCGLPVVLNPAAFTHYSYALRDALAMRTAPLVEVHLSNPAARESFRHTSVVPASPTARSPASVSMSYQLALRAVARLLVGRELAAEQPAAWFPADPGGWRLSVTGPGVTIHP